MVIFPVSLFYCLADDGSSLLSTYSHWQKGGSVGRSVCRASAPGVPREETTQGSWKAENPSVAMQMFMAIYVVALVQLGSLSP